MKVVSDSLNLVKQASLHSLKARSAAEMPAPDSMKWVQLAAYLDGEGCLGIYPNSNTGRTYYSGVLTISQNDPRLTDWLYANFGGSVYINGSKKRYRPIYQWTLPVASMEYVLTLVRPFLILKADQSDCMLEWLAIPNRSVGTPQVESLYWALKNAKKTHHPAAHTAG